MAEATKPKVDTSVRVPEDETEAAEASALRLFEHPEELEQVLFALTQPDNENLRKATLTLASFLEEPRSITCILQQLETSDKAEVRQLAAIYTRESIENYWKKIPLEVQTRVKSFLLQRLVVEDIPAGERLAIAAAITSAARNSMSKAEWPELLERLGAGSAAEAPTPLREACLTIWRNLLMFCGGSLKKHFPRILALIKVGLDEKDSVKVQLESVKAVGAMVEHLTSQEEVDIVESSIPAMVQVVEKCMRRGEEDAVCDGMEVFSDMIESPVPILSRHGLKLTQFMSKVVSTTDLPLAVRKQAVNFMTFMCKSKPKMVCKHKLIQPFLSMSIQLILESDDLEDSFRKDPDAEAKDEDGKDQEAVDFTSPLAIACDLLDEMYLQLPSEAVFPLSVKAIEKLLKSPSAEFKKRKAAYVMMAMMAEGCALYISRGDNLNIMLGACLTGLNDAAPPVRKCALEALSQLATHLNTEVVIHHEKVLKSVFEIFKREDEDVRVKERALSTIEMFIDCYDGDNVHADSDKFPIEKYLKPLMGVIGVCLKSKNKALQIQAVATLASTAACAKSHFGPYVTQVLELLWKLVNIKDPELVELRAEATSCVGAVATASGKETYAPHLEKFHGAIMDGIANIDSASLREASYMYMSDLAELMGADLALLKSFPVMVTYGITSMANDDGLVVQMPDDGFGDSIPKGFLQAQERIEEQFEDECALPDTFESMTDEQLEAYIAEHQLAVPDADDLEAAETDSESETDAEQLMADLQNCKLQVTTGFMQEKAAAIHALKCFVEHCGLAMAEYLDDIWEQLEYLWEYPHPIVKMALTGLIHECLKLVTTAALKEAESENPELVLEEDGVKRLNYSPGKTDYALGAQLEDWLLVKVIPQYVQAILDECDKDVLTMLLSNMCEILPVVGPKAVEKHMTELVKAMVQFFKEKTACFSDAQVESEELAEIAGKHTFVTDNMAELCGVLAQVWGPSFLRAFDQIYPALLRFAKASRHPHDHAMCVGCIADVASRYADSGRPLMKAYADKCYKIALTVAQSEDDNTKQNALYCLGALSLTAGDEVNAKYQATVLRCIKGFTKIPADSSRELRLVRDNAYSALGKVLVSQSAHVSVAELLPSFVSGLPLLADFSENVWVFKVLCRFAVTQKEHIGGLLPRCLQLMCEALPSENVLPPSKREIAKCLCELLKDSEMRAMADALGDEHKAVVRKLMASPPPS